MSDLIKELRGEEAIDYIRQRFGEEHVAKAREQLGVPEPKVRINGTDNRHTVTNILELMKPIINMGDDCRHSVYVDLACEAFYKLHRTEQQHVMRFCARVVIKALAEMGETENFDLRNESSAAAGMACYEQIKDNIFPYV